MQNLDSWLDYIGSEWRSMDFGLDRMRTMVERLELHRPAARVITVAGTNGKGSTVATAEQLLCHAGVSVGATFSPHVHQFNERIRIDGAVLGDEDICAAFSAVEEARGDTPLTYFEYAALAALWSFKQARVDVALLEIGLGGRLDAFNVIDADVAVITSIGRDHEQFLGSDLDSIGAEKAGILRAGQAVVLGRDMPASVMRACRELDLEPLVAGVDFDVVVDPAGGCWQLDSAQDMTTRKLPLGALAPENVALAWHAVRALDDLLNINAGHLEAANASAWLPGRMQEVVVEERRWILDVAHNPAGAEFLAAQLARRGLEPALVVCGMFRDKRHAAVQAALKRHIDAPWWVVSTRGERGLPAEELASALDGAVETVEWQDLVDGVRSASRAGDVILLLGSFDVIEHFGSVLET